MKWKWKWPNCVGLCNPMDSTLHAILLVRILKWVTLPFSRESSQPRDWTQASHIARGFFTSWATRETQECWRGEPIPSPADLPDPGITLAFPGLQADSLPDEISGKPFGITELHKSLTSLYSPNFSPKFSISLYAFYYSWLDLCSWSISLPNVSN